MLAKRELVCAGTRSQLNLPTSRLCLAVIISGLSVNVFRACLPPPRSAPSPHGIERTASARSLARSLATRQRQNDASDRPFEDEIDRRQAAAWCRARNNIARGRGENYIPRPSDIEAARRGAPASDRFLLARTRHVVPSTADARAMYARIRGSPPPPPPPPSPPPLGPSSRCRDLPISGDGRVNHSPRKRSTCDNGTHRESSLADSRMIASRHGAQLRFSLRFLADPAGFPGGQFLSCSSPRDSAKRAFARRATISR
jgi:hypothetical protein